MRPSEISYFQTNHAAQDCEWAHVDPLTRPDVLFLLIKNECIENGVSISAHINLEFHTRRCQIHKISKVHTDMQ